MLFRCSRASLMRPMTAELGLVQASRDPRLMTSCCTSAISARRARAAPSSSRFSAMKTSTSWLGSPVPPAPRPLASPPKPKPPAPRPAPAP